MDTPDNRGTHQLNMTAKGRPGAAEWCSVPRFAHSAQVIAELLPNATARLGGMTHPSDHKAFLEFNNAIHIFGPADS